MQVLQEDTVRQLHLKQGRTEIHIAPKTYVTQQARDYIKEKRLTLIVDEEGKPLINREIRPAPEMAAGQFRTEDGQILDHKPEHMTHLHGNVLVAKTHPRIRLRALSRQVELAAADAFIHPDGTAVREDLLQGYNRLSSAFYILMLQLASAGKEGGRISHE